MDDAAFYCYGRGSHDTDIDSLDPYLAAAVHPDHALANMQLNICRRLYKHMRSGGNEGTSRLLTRSAVLAATVCVYAPVVTVMLVLPLMVSVCVPLWIVDLAVAGLHRLVVVMRDDDVGVLGRIDPDILRPAFPSITISLPLWSRMALWVLFSGIPIAMTFSPL